MWHAMHVSLDSHTLMDRSHLDPAGQNDSEINWVKFLNKNEIEKAL